MCDDIVCRCEEVRRSEIESAIRDGAVTMNEIKRFTRAGMGLCQGRTCRKLVERIAASETGQPIATIQPSTYRQPTRPIQADLLRHTGESTEAGHE